MFQLGLECALWLPVSNGNCSDRIDCAHRIDSQRPAFMVRQPITSASTRPAPLRNSARGLTLVELVIVVLVIAILASLVGTRAASLTN